MGVGVGVGVVKENRLKLVPGWPKGCRLLMTHTGWPATGKMPIEAWQSGGGDKVAHGRVSRGRAPSNPVAHYEA